MAKMHAKHASNQTPPKTYSILDDVLAKLKMVLGLRSARFPFEFFKLQNSSLN
jgi:hypothetical protein